MDSLQRSFPSCTNALLAWKALEQNQTNINGKSAEMTLQMGPLREALSPSNEKPGVFKQLTQPFEDMFKIGKEVVLAITSIYSGDYLSGIIQFKAALDDYVNAEALFGKGGPPCGHTCQFRRKIVMLPS